MIKNILIGLVLVIGLSGLCNASCNIYVSSAGVYTASCYDNGVSGAKIFITSGTYYAETSSTGKVQAKNGTGNTGNAGFRNCLTSYSTGSIKISECQTDEVLYINTWGGYTWFPVPRIYNNASHIYVGSSSNNTYINSKTDMEWQWNMGTQGDSFCYSELTVVLYTDSPKKINGTVDCISNVDKYIWIENDWLYMNSDNTDVDNYYEFDIFNNTDYKLVFSDAHEYIFTCNNSNITYDRDACSHTQYRFEESCGNLIPDSEGYYMEYVGAYGFPTFFHTSDGILDISNSSATKIMLFTKSFVGLTGWIIDPVITDSEYTLENPNINWGLKVIVQNESDSTLIDGATVKVDQSCYCIDGYSTRQKMTVNGMASFNDMSLQDALLSVMASGYKILDENTTGYSTLLSGRSNFSSKTWIVKLAPSSSNNTSSFYEVSNKVDIHFRDVTGNRTSQILDTDAEVHIYYENNNTDEEAMTLKFQSSSTHTYFIDEQSWTIAHDDIGHKTIANSYFTPWDYSYRAVIYNSSIYGWNMTVPLTVRNGTREIEQHYQNLTTNLWLRHAHDGRVDYRDDMSVAIHARSNNTTLMKIDVELWDNGAYLNHVNLTEYDFATADFPYYYTWNPIYDYETGHNYTVLMYGFDRTLLETDYVECISDDTTRKNKLTIGVKDSHGEQLTNAYIHLEDWGSLHTGSVYYNAYEGVDNGAYRYKATKSGYTGGGWNEVNLTDEDKIVWYVLTEDYTATAFSQTKFEDKDIKGIFFPLMYFLLICLILGGLKYVAS